VAETLFYAFALAAVAFAIGTVASRSPMASVLSLLGAFVALAGIYLLAGFEFLAAAQVIVYAGAIMVLFLFVIMLLNLGNLDSLAEHPARALGKRRVALAALAAAGLLAVTLAAASRPIQAAGGAAARRVDGAGGAAGGQRIDQILPSAPGDSIAGLLFSRYLLPFEASSLILLAALVAVITLAKRERRAPRTERRA
jgi:NADH-quinone oxidoreductase subunit J